MKTDNKVHFVPFKHSFMLPTNDRIHTHESLLDNDVVMTGPTEGQRAVVTVAKIKYDDAVARYGAAALDGAVADKSGCVYGHVCGNRRRYSFGWLAKQNVIDPLTVKRDDKGQIIPGSGDVFSGLQSLVYEEMSEKDINTKMNDNTGKKLNELEIVRRVMKTRLDERQEKPTLLANYGLLLEAYPVEGADVTKYNAFVNNLPVEASELRKSELIRDYHIGGPSSPGAGKWRLHNRYVTWVAAYDGPALLKDAFEQRLQKKGFMKLSDALIRSLASLYHRDVEDRGAKSTDPEMYPDGGTNRAGNINPDAPGPRFMAEWNRVVTDMKAAELENRSIKAASMLSQNDVKKLLAGQCAKSRTLSFVLSFVLNRVKGSIFEEFVQTFLRFEAGTLPKADYESKLAEFWKEVEVVATVPDKKTEGSEPSGK